MRRELPRPPAGRPRAEQSPDRREVFSCHTGHGLGPAAGLSPVDTRLSGDTTRVDVGTVAHGTPVTGVTER